MRCVIHGTRIDSLADNGRTHLYSYDDAGERSIKDADRQGITAYVSQYYTVRNATLGTKHVYVGMTWMASTLPGAITYLRGKSGRPTTPGPPGGAPPGGTGQGTLHRSAQATAHAQNTLKNPHYADPSLPLTVVQENTQIAAPAYSDWEYAFPESYDVATLGGGSEHLYFYHADHLGSTGYVTREDAALVEHVQYFPFGETWVQEGKHTERTPYLFTSKELDEESGLYYFGARYYDPRTSVWQSVDPILGQYLPTATSGGKLVSGGVFKTDNLNLYHYAGLNPLRYVDPNGMWDEKVHYEATEKWAKAADFSNEQAERIASANNGVDSLLGGKSWAPGIGDQGYHFNTNKTGNDSRMDRFLKSWASALEWGQRAQNWRTSETSLGGWFKNLVADFCAWVSLGQLGQGLHALQDIDAHSEEYVQDFQGLFYYHDSPELNGKTNEADFIYTNNDKKQFNDRYLNTQGQTMKYLNEYRRLVPQQ